MSAMKHSKSEVLLAVLIDIPPEDAAIVLTFEDAVLPLLNRHGGQLQRRLRAVDQSAELQIISFDSREAKEAFATDPSRLQLMRATARPPPPTTGFRGCVRRELRLRRPIPW